MPWVWSIAMYDDDNEDEIIIIEQYLTIFSQCPVCFFPPHDVSANEKPWISVKLWFADATQQRNYFGLGGGPRHSAGIC
jgi:hypothetical protein